MTDSGESLTPMMRQYLEVKESLPEKTILLFRMGDFYELFFDDASQGSDIWELHSLRERVFRWQEYLITP